MKTKFLAVMLALTGLESWAQTPPGLPSLPTRTRPPRYTANVITNSAASPTTQPRYTAPQNGSSAAPTDTAGNSTAPDGPAASAPTAAASAADLEMLPAGTINFQSADLNQVLEIYSKYVGRTLLRGNVGDAKVILKTVTPLTRREVIEALQAVLALNNVSVVNVGEKFVKVVPSAEAATAAGELDRRKAEDLPNLGSYLTHVVQLRYVKPSEMLPWRLRRTEPPSQISRRH